LALPLLPLLWIAAANEPWHETDNDREFLFTFARWFSLAVLGLVVAGMLLLSGVGHRRPR
jgi:putative copper export protein